MFHRLIHPLPTSSFFLFGARGTGKTTFLKEFFSGKRVLWINLLNPVVEDLYSRKPETISQELAANKGKVDWIVIDEVQKVPSLLDLAHLHIEESGIKFALTGSSARKLKRGDANLLAGRALINHLFPLTHVELGGSFVLEDVLRWGSLPKMFHLAADEEKREFLQAYALTYLKEEVWAEQVLRRLDPFRRFLEVAAQSNGEIVNYSNIAKDVGADTKTVQSYFQVLEDTLIGFLLEPYHHSVRKRQRQNPRFYFLDTGVRRALAGSLSETLTPGSYSFGRAFEHFVILEIFRLNHYRRKDYRFSYLTTKDGAEIDLIVEQAGKTKALIEIKSTESVDDRDTRHLEQFLPNFSNAEAFCLSRDSRSKKIGSVYALPWEKGLVELGLV